MVEASLTGLESEERDQKRREIEALVRDRIKDSDLLESADSAPLVLEDVVFRDPYRQGQGDEAALEMIYGIDRAGELKELSRLSKVVDALTPFEAYRVYYRLGDDETKSKLDKLISGVCK